MSGGSDTAMAKSSFFSELQESAVTFWAVRNARERTILLVGGTVVLLGLLYMILFAPALKGRAQLNKSLPEQTQRVAQMRAMATQAADLKGAAAVPVDPVSQDTVSASLVAHGLKAKSLSVSDGVVRVQFDPVSFAGVFDWVNEQQKTTHLTVVEANFIGSAQIDIVNATLTLKQQHSGG